MILGLITITVYYLNIKKYDTLTIESFIVKRPTNYIFWTGGYDSTFRILEALLVDKVIIVPIYLSGIIDNNANKKTRRNNNKQELAALTKIIKIIYETYPNEAKYLKPLLIIPEVTISKKVVTSMDILYRKRMVRRPVCQYGALAQVSLDMNHPIELAVEKEPDSSMMYNSIYNKVQGHGINCKIKSTLIKRYPELEIYQNFRFSTLHLSKKDMLKIAIKHGFSNILKLTWSCWYPQNGKPCQQCIMCKERLI